MKKNNGLAKIPIILATLLLAILIPVTVNLVGRSQETRRQAADTAKSPPSCSISAPDSQANFTVTLNSPTEPICWPCNPNTGQSCPVDPGFGILSFETLFNDSRDQIQFLSTTCNGTFDGNICTSPSGGSCQATYHLNTIDPGTLKTKVANNDGTASCTYQIQAPSPDPTSPAPTCPPDSPYNEGRQDVINTYCGNGCVSPNSWPKTLSCHSAPGWKPFGDTCEPARCDGCVCLTPTPSPEPTSPAPTTPVNTPHPTSTLTSTPIPPTSTPPLVCDNLSIPANTTLRVGGTVSLTCTANKNSHHFNFKASLDNTPVYTVANNSQTARYSYPLTHPGSYYFLCQACANSETESNKGGCTAWVKVSSPQ